MGGGDKAGEDAAVRARETDCVIDTIIEHNNGVRAVDATADQWRCTTIFADVY